MSGPLPSTTWKLLILVMHQVFIFSSISTHALVLWPARDVALLTQLSLTTTPKMKSRATLATPLALNFPLSLPLTFTAARSPANARKAEQFSRY
ncbi:hypothetical protein M758_UG341700 [Ceratodon purpureus]|nr:hypothetical protein M758_UG341700 [Ceratodon purpureus]